MQARGRAELGSMTFENCNERIPANDMLFLKNMVSEASERSASKSLYGTVWFSVSKSENKHDNENRNFFEEKLLINAHKKIRDEKIRERLNIGIEDQEKGKIHLALKPLFDDFDDAYGYSLPRADKFSVNNYLTPCRTIAQLGYGYKTFQTIFKVLKSAEISVFDELSRSLIHYCCAYR